MWPSEALQALGVIVFLTVMTTVDASESVPSVTSDIPGEIVGHSDHDRDRFNEDETIMRTVNDQRSTTTTTTTTTTNNIDEYNAMKISMLKNETRKINEDNYNDDNDNDKDNDNSSEQKSLQSTYYSLIVDTVTTKNWKTVDRFFTVKTSDDSATSGERMTDVIENPIEENDEEYHNENQEYFNRQTNRTNNLESNTENETSTINHVGEIIPGENFKAISFQISSANDNDKNNDKSFRKNGGNLFADFDKSSATVGKDHVQNHPYKKTKQLKGIVNNRDGLNVDLNKQDNGDNNQIDNKQTAKSFYEIKSLLTTEIITDIDGNVDLNQNSNQRKFILPTIPSAMGKYGPYFEDGPEEKNITARIGSTVLLDCKIGMLHDKMVTWLQHSRDSIHLLTVARQVYSADQRVSLSFRYPSNWRLQILYASPRDSGLYECQVATHPPRIKKINLIVTAPVLTIVDDAGRVVAAGERHLKAGSILKLSCEARDVREVDGESVVWTRGDETLVDNVSENKTSESIGGEEIRVVVSTVSVERATPRHAGNYSCSVPGRTKSTVVVHVLNGELPAAVHDGNGVSRAVLNFWLVHLTISYVFSR